MNTPFKNPALACCFHAKSRQDADDRAEFQQKHCGPALVNKHWDEEDQWYCSPFNAAPEEEKMVDIHSSHSLSSCTGTWKHYP